ncbi:YchJ family protein [Paraglaciecola sp. L3A3]|uniref:YchJ family protein n=1 Tax=Paraglaciecola sp. L3A3 TaxID=2686358 RepID=UPI00131C5780|nr:YchJ family protein [Paraglaciecola sp. L3A3]
MNTTQPCHCQSNLPFIACCQPYIDGDKAAPTAEKLMRSRFSAYVLQNYDYILKTYAEKNRKDLFIEQLKQDSIDTEWLSLQVLHHSSKQKTAQVEFKAYYQIGQQLYLMHELSNFIFENDQWLYTTGTMLKGSGKYQQQRNDPCLCSSGKKFKKCCGK